MEHPKEYPFFVDGKRFTSKEESIDAAKLKALVDAPANYQVFLEEEGDTPDRALSDKEGVTLSGKEKHFFVVPPATFGSG